MIKSRARWGFSVRFYDFDGKKNICGERIYQIRTTRRLSQAALAAKMQMQGVVIEREAISKIETGLRLVTDYELAAFADVLQVSILWLIGRE